MIRSSIALAIGILIALCVIAFGFNSGEPGYGTDENIGTTTSSEDYNYDSETSSFSSDDMESSESDDEFP